MKREKMLGGALGALLVATLVTGAVVPGVLAEPDRNVRPSHFAIQHEPGSIDAVSVDGGTGTLQLETRIRHEGATAENVTVEVRAIDGETGLLEDQRRTTLGTVEGETERTVLTNLTVERAGGYRIETFVYGDGTLKARAQRSVDGVGSLTPEYARSTVGFQTFTATDADLPTIVYSIESVENERATLNVSAYLQNEGDGAAGDVTLRLRARQAESNVVADRSTIRVGSIGEGKTATPGATLTVPDGYNYWLDAILLKNDVVIDTASEPANLDPTETLAKNESRTDVGFRSGDFADSKRDGTGDEPVTTVAGGGPGMGVGVAVVALLGTATLIARRNHD